MTATQTTKPMMTASALRERGWTDTDIVKFMPKPCATKPNPYYRRAGAPMRFYKTKRVFDIEQSAAFQDHTKNRASRKAAAKKSAETRRKKTAEKAKHLINEFRVYALPTYYKLEQMAIEAQQDRAMSRGIFFGSNEIDDETKERWVVNFVRHECSDYDFILTKIKGLVGTGDAYDKIRASVDEKVDAAIQATK